jgi:ABC-type phosphate transport system substrate-binding protein
MKIKKIFTSVIAGASLLAIVGAASAATTYTTGTGTPTMPTSDLNVYGASAEFNFFKTEFGDYLTAAGCTLGSSLASSDGKHFVQQANCGGTTVNWRVSSKASYDGPLAVDGNTTNPSRDITCEASNGPTYRSMLSIDGTMGCQPVTIGASDVQVGDFVQQSNGALYGPYGGTATTRNFLANPFVLSANTTDYCRPLAIPFAFFVNNTVTKSDTTILDNISTAEAKMIFSGVIKNWADLQAVAMTSQPVNVCYRHAGSGTHATLDAFMKPSTLLKNAVTGGTSAHYYFNDGSSDMMRCVNGGTYNGVTWSGAGAVGYADADQAIGSGSSYPVTSRLTLDGNTPTTANVDDYTYPFATIQNLYANTTVAGTNVMQDLCTFASQPSKITLVNPNWSASCNMKHIKNTNFGNFLTNTNYHNANCN